MDRIVATAATVLLSACYSPGVVADSAAAAAKGDYLATDTRGKAEQLWRDGDLERVHLFPLDGGGEDIDLNVVYVPRHVAAAKAELDQRILEMAAQGHVADYESVAEYRDVSFIPTRIVVRALAADGQVLLEQTIDVW